jgi:SpoVK/Ycf46/Vps4 family AAA+-type ATPase
MSEDVNLDEISKLCNHFTGADIKSLVCDAMIKAFHRVYDINNENELFEDNLNKYFDNKKNKNENDIISNIMISNVDFLSSIKTIQKSINKTERQNLNKL